jgi:hypothetical protein
MSSTEHNKHNFDNRRKEKASRKKGGVVIHKGRSKWPNVIAPYKLKQIDEDYDLFSDGSSRRHREG